MSPRPYRLGQRQVATEKTRARIISAARELLMESSGYARFSIDAVARQADVARMTVYHQFGSKIGLLEALCDSLAASGGMQQMATAFKQPEPLDALKEYLLVFGRFWNVDRLVMRRLRALCETWTAWSPSCHVSDEALTRIPSSLVVYARTHVGCTLLSQ